MDNLRVGDPEETHSRWSLLVPDTSSPTVKFLI